MMVKFVSVLAQLVSVKEWLHMATQVLCETTGLTADKVFVERPDTVRTARPVQLLHLVKQYSLVKQLAKQVFA
ncbi:MAG: hypothetical protein ACLUPK_07160 [Veillonella sp.]